MILLIAADSKPFRVVTDESFILTLRWKKKKKSDIEIATAQTPKLIDVLAEEIGITGNELDMYGKYKAKVDLSILERLAHRK